MGGARRLWQVVRGFGLRLTRLIFEVWFWIGFQEKCKKKGFEPKEAWYQGEEPRGAARAMCHGVRGTERRPTRYTLWCIRSSSRIAVSSGRVLPSEGYPLQKSATIRWQGYERGMQLLHTIRRWIDLDERNVWPPKKWGCAGRCPGEIQQKPVGGFFQDC